jgi:hypothetical protein
VRPEDDRSSNIPADAGALTLSVFGPLSPFELKEKVGHLD